MTPPEIPQRALHWRCKPCGANGVVMVSALAKGRVTATVIITAHDRRSPGCDAIPRVDRIADPPAPKEEAPDGKTS